MNPQRARSQKPCMLMLVSGAMVSGIEDVLFHTLRYKHLAHFMTLWYALIINAPAEESDESYDEGSLSRRY